MSPTLFFCRKQIIRECNFLSTYAEGQELVESIAYAADLKALRKLNKDLNVSIIITTDNLIRRVVQSKGAVCSENPQKDFYKLHNYLVKGKQIKLTDDSCIDITADISPTSRIGKNVKIGKNVIVRDYSIIESNTVIGDDCEIGSFVTIGSKSMHRTIIDGRLFHLEHAGGVKIGDRTRVLTGAIIQKPYQAFYTSIGADSVISTKVVIGHGSQIGNRALLSGNSAVAGNCRVGNDTWIGGGAALSDGVSVGSNAKVLIGSVVIRDVDPHETVSGNFAINHRQNLRNQVKLKR